MDEHEQEPLWYGHHRHVGVIGGRPPSKWDVICSGVVWCILGAVLGFGGPEHASLAAVLELAWPIALGCAAVLGLLGGILGVAIPVPGNTAVRRLWLGVVLAGGCSICGLLLGALFAAFFGGIGAVLVWVSGPWGGWPTSGIIGAGLGGLFGAGKALRAVRAYRKEWDMGEADWLACTDPERMLEFLRGRASDRKLRLFAAACYRRNWFLPFNNMARCAADVLDRHVEGSASAEELAGARLAVGTRWALEPDSWLGAVGSVRWVSWDPSAQREDWQRLERHAQCALLRDVFGNPFRPVSLNPAWLTPAVLSLAQAAYEQRQLPSGSLDQARLAVLADALEDAGCTDTDLLEHLRGPGPHARGCFLLDCLLGKE